LLPAIGGGGDVESKKIDGQVISVGGLGDLAHQHPSVPHVQ